MANDAIKIDVQGLDELQKALKKFPLQTAKYMGAAGKEAAEKVILPTRGLKKYPPHTEANMPPTPYYIRGRGTQLKSRNLLNSERLGTQFYVKKGLETEIGNRASYAPFVVGEEQARAMGVIGWRKLLDVAEDQMPKLVKVYNAWVAKLLKDIKLT